MSAPKTVLIVAATVNDAQRLSQWMGYGSGWIFASDTLALRGFRPSLIVYYGNYKTNSNWLAIEHEIQTLDILCNPVKLWVDEREMR